MKVIFADSFYYIALISSRDDFHERAKSLASQKDFRIVTTNYILVETCNGFSSPLLRTHFHHFLALLEDNSDTVVIPASEMLFHAGLELHASRIDKAWSLTDCISFVVMEEYDIREALTHDRHFEQAGFIALLK